MAIIDLLYAPLEVCGRCRKVIREGEQPWLRVNDNLLLCPTCLDTPAVETDYGDCE